MVGQSKYYYYQRSDSIVNSTFNIGKLFMLESCQNMIDYSKKNGGKYDKEANAFYLKSAMMLLMQIYGAKDSAESREAKKKLKEGIRKHKQYIWGNKYLPLRKNNFIFNEKSMDSGETNLYIMENKNGKLAMSDNKTLIIKSSANDFERYYSHRMSGNGNEVKEYLKPHISADNMIWKFVLKIIRRLDAVVPIYTTLFGDWWKSISQYDRIIVFDYNATPQMMRRIRKSRPDVELLLWVWNTAPDNIEDFKKYSKIYCFDSSSCEKWNLFVQQSVLFFPG